MSGKIAYHGNLESVANGTIDGWIVDVARPGDSCDVTICIDFIPVARIRPDIIRTDVFANHGGRLESGFSFPVPRKFQDGKPHLVAVLGPDASRIGPQLVYQSDIAGPFYDRISCNGALAAVAAVTDGGFVGRTAQRSPGLRIVFPATADIEPTFPAAGTRLTENFAGREALSVRHVRPLIPYRFEADRARVNPEHGLVYIGDKGLWTSTCHLRSSNAVVADIAAMRGSAAIAERPGKFVLFSTTMNRNYYHWHLDCLAGIVAQRPLLDDGWQLICGDLADWQLDSIRLVTDAPIVAGQHHVVALEKVSGYCYMEGRGQHPDKGIARMFGHLSRHAAGAAAAPTKLFISRADVNTRRLRNEDELWQFLSQEGFERVVLSSYSYLEQIRLFAAAECVVASHGAGLTNIGFCRRNVSVVEIIPEDYGNACFRFLAIRMGLNHHMYRSGTLSDFVVDLPMFKTFFRDLSL